MNNKNIVRASIVLAVLAIVVAVLTACGGGGTTDQAIAEAAAASTPTVVQVQPKATEPVLTTGQKNALRSAKTYVSVMSFSKAELLHQLTAFDHYTDADANYAISQLKVDYKKQAVKSAKAYLDFTGFSREGLITQLTTFDKYTDAEATYAADQVGL